MASISSLLLLLPFPLLVSLCRASDDQLAPSKALIFPQDKLISKNKVFALGLFSLTTNSSTRSYLGIWYNKIPERRYVWVANFDNPITNSSSASLVVTNRSELVLADREGRIYWTSAPPPTAITTDDSPGGTATLHNEGNLVLCSSNGSFLWQSFDHPTDTVLPGMPLRMNPRKDYAERLVSWKGPDDPSTGNFSVGGDVRTGFQFMIWNGSTLSWRSTAWNGKTFISSYVWNDNNIVIGTRIVAEGDDISLTYTVSAGSPAMNARMSYTGRYEFNIWNSIASNWTVLYSFPEYECDRYDSCGPFGYCDGTEANPTCKCPDGFEPQGARPSGGCARKMRLRCGGEDQFVTLQNMKTPANPVLVRNRSIDGCAAECLNNCNCSAYAYAMFSTAVSGGDPSRCLLWFGELLDLGLYPREGNGENLYLRLAGSPAKRRRKDALVKAILGYSRAPNELGDENVELPFVKFRDIAAATYNFSEDNMLGQGGFGIVYKGTLGQNLEVAIKRLSQASGQGVDEFRNEVILIAKLQHRNLVRLLGCCIHGDEKLLIYEYLPNKSLDSIIFDAANKDILDWPTRFKIIKGISRGLQYLHQDSRLTVIHRDLKTSNILLDADMSPKISDFGMARIFGGNEQEANTNRVVGTYGYMSPEYAMDGAFSVKSDTYSFGVIVLEIISGLKIGLTNCNGFLNLLAYAWSLWTDGKVMDLVDSCLAKSCSPTEALRCIQIGLLCVQDNPSSRPLMSSVVTMLENETTPLPVPKQPMCFSYWGAQGTGENTSSSSQNNTSLSTMMEGW
ncbi:hypothetical protein U9M48_033985 [Paspalum notatum var. saurae]|uniref:Receptor-like serine/threonine-protein kinase n=1 Tax=Paspalum notatum var. saurae TaxID=547442 RepID=A0AAQ3U8J3_PASNO